MEGSQQFDLLFIRHAESSTNKQTEDFVKRTQIVYDWQHLSSNHEYLQAIKYAYALLDAPITKEGVQQCKAAKQEIANIQPDIILVSPLNRALMTCQEIFGQAKCPIIVEPLLSEGLRSSCDFSCQLAIKQQNFPGYDFSKVLQMGPFWFLSNESEQNAAKYREIIEKNKEKSYLQIIQLFFTYMLQTWIYESPTNLRRRTGQLKLLLKEYSKKYKLIAVVTHYNIIRFSLAKEFNQHDEPFHCHIGNCEISRLKADKL